MADTIMPESFIWALENYNSSVVVIHCSNENTSEVKEKFREILKRNWEKAYDDMVDEYCKGEGYSEDNHYIPLSKEESNPLVYLETDSFEKDSIVAEFSPMLIQYCYGDFCVVYEACKAVEDSFEELKKEFPGIFYIGFAAFPWSDRRCGDVESFVITSVDSNSTAFDETIHRIVSDILAYAVNGETISGEPVDFDEDYSFLSKLSEELSSLDSDDFEEIVNFLEEYYGYLDTSTFSLIVKSCIDVSDELAEEDDEYTEISEALCYLLNNVDF